VPLRALAASLITIDVASFDDAQVTVAVADQTTPWSWSCVRRTAAKELHLRRGAAVTAAARALNGLHQSSGPIRPLAAVEHRSAHQLSTLTVTRCAAYPPYNCTMHRRVAHIKGVDFILGA